MAHSNWRCLRARLSTHASFLLLVVICALTLGASAHAKPVTYMFVVQRTPDAIDPFGIHLSPSGSLVTPSGTTLNFGPPNGGEVIITLIFEGDTSDAIYYFFPCGSGCKVSGSEIIKGTAGFMINDAATGNLIAQGTFSPSDGIFVSIDSTNGGAGFGSSGVDPSSPSFPGQPIYPWALDQDPYGVLSPYDLRSDFAYGLWAPDFSYGSGTGRVPGHSCVDFPAVTDPCDDPLPLATTAGTLYFDQSPFTGFYYNPAEGMLVQTHARRLGDFNGDHRADLIWRNPFGGDNTVWLMGREGTKQVSLPANFDPYTEIAAVGDFNGDGRADILWRGIGSEDSAPASLGINDGTGNSFTSQDLPPLSLEWQIAGTGDFNADGKTDVLWRNRSTGENTLWLMGGSTPTVVSLPTQTDLNWQVAGVADFNGDGNADVLWFNGSTGEVDVWLMNGATRTRTVSLNGTHPGSPLCVAGNGDDDSASSCGSADLTWKISAVGDFGGTKHSAIVWKNQVSGQIYLWSLNSNATEVRSGRPLGQVSDLLWDIDGVGDLNGDGKDDLVWRHHLTGQNRVWFMDGTRVLDTRRLETVSDPGSLID